MIRFIRFLVGTSFIICVEVNAMVPQGMTPIVSNGETTVVFVNGNTSTQAVIFTHEKQIRRPSDRVPSVVDSSCTYSRYPCSIVDRIAITVNGHSLFVPRSVFCDLADVNRAKIDRRKGGYTLILEAGDASTGYDVKIDFDTTRVTRKTRIAGEANEPLEATTYYRVTM